MIHVLMSGLNGFRCVEMVFDNEETAYHVRDMIIADAEFNDGDPRRIWFIQSMPLNKPSFPTHIPKNVFVQFDR